jgi:hypothetical protein
MKTKLRIISFIAALAFALAAATEFVGLVSFRSPMTTILLGGFVVSFLVAFALGDYARKPSFRVRRTATDSTDAGPTVNRPAGPGPDWTYTTRSK